MLGYRAMLVFALLLGVGLAGAIIYWYAQPQRESSMPTAAQSDTNRRLAILLRQRPDYRVWIGVPAHSPTAWASASGKLRDGTLQVEGYGQIPLDQVRLFIVAYANGQMVDAELGGLPVPNGIAGLSPARKGEVDVLRLADLEEGKKYVQIRYGPSTLHPGDRRHYATTLTNISNEKIRVVKFAGYTRTGDVWQLSTVTGRFFSAQEFQEWYEVTKDEWLAPGKSACDPNNYGSPPVMWAYYCQSESGKEFIAGGVLE